MYMYCFINAPVHVLQPLSSPCSVYSSTDHQLTIIQLRSPVSKVTVITARTTKKIL